MEVVVRAVFCAFLVVFFSACPNNNTDNCGDGCPRGQLCSSGQCVSLELPRVEGRIGGQSSDMTPIGETGFAVASIDPSTKQIIVTVVDDEVESRVLHTFTESVTNRVALSASRNRIGVVWREGTNFVYGSRAIATNGGFWDFETVEGEFIATDDFDVAIDSADAPSIAFRDGQGTFRAVSRGEGEDATWSVSTIDGGGKVAGRGCQESELFEPNLGIDPQLEILGTQVVSYYDGVCGDLRVAQRFESEWKIDIVDEGDDVINSAQDRVGRFSGVTRDVNGDLQVSYFDETRRRLKLASERDGQFELSVVDEGIAVDELARTRKTIVGSYTSIAVRADGEQRIVYFDSTNQALLVAARRQGQTWETSVVDRNNIAGMHAQVRVIDGEFIAVYERITPTIESLSTELSWREVAP